MKVIPETERTWWRLFQKLNVPDEGYSRNASWGLNVISMFLLDYLSVLTKNEAHVSVIVDKKKNIHTISVYF
jgi:hypothetical protein